MAAQGRFERAKGRLLRLARLQLPLAQVLKLCANLDDQTNPLLIEKVIALVDQASLILELQLSDPSDRRLTGVSHVPLPTSAC